MIQLHAPGWCQLTQDDLAIRLGQTDDLPFIKDSWTRSMASTYPNQYIIDFHAKFHRQIDVALTTSTILVSALDSDSTAIVCYLVYTSFEGQLVVLYAYTRAEQRRQGFVNQLLQFANPNSTPTIFCFPAKNANAMSHLAHKYIFDPYLLTFGVPSR